MPNSKEVAGNVRGGWMNPKAVSTWLITIPRVLRSSFEKFELNYL